MPGRSLANTAVLQLFLVAAGATFAATAMIFFHLMTTQKEEALGRLMAFNHQRAIQQATAIKQLEEVQKAATDQFMRARAITPVGPAQTAFDRLFPLRPDGSRRGRTDLYSGTSLGPGDSTHGIAAYFGDGRHLRPEEKRDLLVIFEAVRSVGRAKVAGIDNFYFTSAPDKLIIYAPNRADRLLFYRETAPAGFPIVNEEVVRITRPTANPRREIRCTSLQPLGSDRTGRIWTSGCHTPVDVEGRHIGQWGVSLLLDELIRRFPSLHLTGSTTILATPQGRLIQHNNLIRQGNTATGSYLDILSSHDPVLIGTWKTALATPTGKVSFDRHLGLYISVERVAGPGWLSIAAYPSDLIASSAFQAAAIWLWIGGGLLVVQAIMLLFILRGRVSQPLEDLTSCIEELAGHVTASDDPPFRSDLKLPTHKKDEIGRIARSFLYLANCIFAEKRRLEEAVQARTAALMKSERRFRTLTELSTDIILRTDGHGRCIYVSPSVGEAFGLPVDEVKGRNMLDLIHEQDRDRVRTLGSEVLADPEARRVVEFRASHADGTVRWLESHVRRIEGLDDPAGLLSIMRDVTERKLLEVRLREAATIDPLTGVPNRSQLEQAVDIAILDANLRGGFMALAILDLDRFKTVNDMLGHPVGDALLRRFASEMRSLLKEGDSLVRLGGDEFAVVMPGRFSRTEAESDVWALMQLMPATLLVDQRTLDARASVGVAVFPGDGEDSATLLKSADMALYAAKRAGGGRVKLFDPELRGVMQREASMIEVARDLVQSRAIRPFYQPQVRASGGALHGLEALLRWQHPTAGVQGPETILSALDDPALGSRITECVLDAVIDDMVAWRDRGIDFGHISINVSAADFLTESFASDLVAKLNAASIPTSRFGIEVTETVLLGRSGGRVEQALRELKAANISIALDDFGTGYASLSHLRHLPVDVIKLDRSFVAGLPDDLSGGAIVKTLLQLARSLGILTIAEGVETEAQRSFLAGHGCAVIQGFLIAPPSPADVLELICAGFPQDCPEEHLTSPVQPDEVAGAGAAKKCQIMGPASPPAPPLPGK